MSPEPTATFRSVQGTHVGSAVPFSRSVTGDVTKGFFVANGFMENVGRDSPRAPAPSLPIHVNEGYCNE